MEIGNCKKEARGKSEGKALGAGRAGREMLSWEGIRNSSGRKRWCNEDLNGGGKLLGQETRKSQIGRVGGDAYVGEQIGNYHSRHPFRAGIQPWVPDSAVPLPPAIITGLLTSSLPIKSKHWESHNLSLFYFNCWDVRDLHLSPTWMVWCWKLFFKFFQVFFGKKAGIRIKTHLFKGNIRFQS